MWPAAVQLAGLLAAGSLLAQPGPQRHEAVWGAMGTRFQVTVCASDTTGLAAAFHGARRAVARIEHALSDYDPASEVSLLATHPRFPGIPVSSILWRAWEVSDSLHRVTEGAFDVRLGAMTRLWRHAFRRGSLPDPAALDSVRRLAGPEAFEAAAGRFAITAGARLDFGGIGKGIAGDSVVALLRAAGFDRVLVDAGGDLTAGAGPPDVPGWRVRVGEGTEWWLADGAIASSGDAHRYIEAGGHRYSHILDPATGLGLSDAPSVTVRAESGTLADALATALTVRSELADVLIGDGRVAILRQGDSVRTWGQPPAARAASPTCQTPRP